MKQTFTASVWKEGNWFVAQCLQVDVTSQGCTEVEALDNLREALELHFEPPIADAVPNVRSVEVEEIARVHSPRLVYKEQESDFIMEIVKEPSDALLSQTRQNTP